MQKIVSWSKAMDMVNGEDGWRVVPATIMVSPDDVVFVVVEKEENSGSVRGAAFSDIFEKLEEGRNVSFVSSGEGLLRGKYLRKEGAGTGIVKIQLFNGIFDEKGGGISIYLK